MDSEIDSKSKGVTDGFPSGRNDIHFVESTTPQHQDPNFELWRKYDELAVKHNHLEKQHEKLEEKINRATDRSVEVIGIFSGILALIIVNVDLVRDLTFFPAVLLVGAMTASLGVFASLVHFFFGQEKKKKLGKTFGMSWIVLILFIAIGAVLYFFKINIDSISNVNGNTAQSNANNLSNSN